MIIILKYLVFGAGAALFLIVLAKVVMAKLLQRPEGYYGDGEVGHMVESAEFYDPKTPSGYEREVLMDRGSLRVDGSHTDERKGGGR